MKRFVACLMVLLLGMPAGAAVSVKKDLDRTTQELKGVQQALREKRVEKERAMLDEKTTRSELARIQKAHERLQREGETLRRGILAAEKKLAQASRDLRAAGLERRRRSDELCGSVDGYYRLINTYARLYTTPVTERLYRDALRNQQGCLLTAMDREAQSRQVLERWRTADARLRTLKKQQEAMAAEQASLREQKQELLKSAIGRRVVAEEDIKKLQESATALQQFIIRLEKKRKRAEDEAVRKRSMQGRKRSLHWPVNGQIVARFGRNRHPELDTVTISNGIRIQAQPGAPVTSVEKGTVLFAGTFRSYGQMVIVDHGGGFCSIYGQLGGIAVEEEQTVIEGGTVGSIARTGPAVLYFEIRSDGQAEDPLLWLEEKH